MIEKILYSRRLGKIGRRQGGTYYLSLPLEEVKYLQRHKGEILFVQMTDDGFTIKKADYRNDKQIAAMARLSQDKHKPFDKA